MFLNRMGSALPAIIGCPRAILSRNQTREIVLFFLFHGRWLCCELYRYHPSSSIEKACSDWSTSDPPRRAPCIDSQISPPPFLLNTESIERGFWLHLSSTVAEELGRYYLGRRQLRWSVVSRLGGGNFERWLLRKITWKRWFRIVRKWFLWYFYAGIYVKKKRS